MEHREIKSIKLYENGGFTIIFEDNTHTYIEPEIMQEVVEEFNKLNIK